MRLNYSNPSPIILVILSAPGGHPTHWVRKYFSIVWEARKKTRLTLSFLSYIVHALSGYIFTIKIDRKKISRKLFYHLKNTDSELCYSSLYINFAQISLRTLVHIGVQNLPTLPANESLVLGQYLPVTSLQRTILWEYLWASFLCVSAASYPVFLFCFKNLAV